MLVMRFTGTADGWLHFAEPIYLKSFDVMTGGTHLTQDRSHAIRFATLEGALAFWRTIPTAAPVRYDGEPNRPLMAFNLIPEVVDELAG